jgi:hypothetical protein
MKIESLHATGSGITAWMCLMLAAGLPLRAAEPPKGLVLHFSFDKAEPGGAIIDASDKHNNGVLAAAKWVAAGKQGGACEFIEKGSHIDVPHSESLDLKQATLAVWFKTGKADAAWRRLLDKQSDNGFALGIAGDSKDGPSRGKLAFAINGSVCLSDNVVTDGAWHHAAATFDGTTLALFVDGRPQKQTLALRGAIGSNTHNLTVGLNRANPSPDGRDASFEGVMDEVMLFNRALSADEIKNLVAAIDPNAGKPKFTKQQLAGRIRQLTLLYEEGLLTDEFYEEKVREFEAAAQ